MLTLTRLGAFASLLSTGAIFGFFYAWACSAMWGLDGADPRVAIEAMQAMNRAVRNAAFGASFFGAPVILCATAALAFAARERTSAGLFALAAVVYVVGGMALTVSMNVPMNNALAAIETPADAVEAAEVWRAYSAPWQNWNWARTGFSGLALLIVGAALAQLGRRTS